MNENQETLINGCELILKYVEGWGMLKEVEGGWRMLKVEGGWGMLKEVEEGRGEVEEVVEEGRGILVL